MRRVCLRIYLIIDIHNDIIMSEYSLKERVQMLTSSLVYGGPMTFEQIKKLDWLKNTSEYGILFYPVSYTHLTLPTT